METTTWLEAIVFVVSAATLAFAVWSLWNSHLDHRILTRLQLNGVKRLTMRARLMRDVSRVSCAGVLCAAALFALHEPPDRDRLALVLKVTVLVVSGLLGMAVVADWRWRRDLDEALEVLDAQNCPNLTAKGPR